jgi:uncharacterized protein
MLTPKYTDVRLAGQPFILNRLAGWCGYYHGRPYFIVMNTTLLFKLGKYQILKVDEVSEFGFFLVNPDADQIIADAKSTGLITVADENSESGISGDTVDGAGASQPGPQDWVFAEDASEMLTRAKSQSGHRTGREPDRAAPVTPRRPATPAKEARVDTSERSNRVLLPNRLATRKPKKGDLIRVFLYRDNEERLTATFQEPVAQAGEFACLEVRNSDDRGAWLKWGLDKDLFAPYREQTVKMEAGRSYVVHIYVDTVTNRLAASARIDRFVSNADLSVKEKDKVNLLIWKQTDLGYKVIINGRHHGLIYTNEIFNPVIPGMRIDGYIKIIREDGNIDVSPQPIGFDRAAPDAERILQALEDGNGWLDLHDKSDPEDIKARLHMSKRAFKQATGTLLKQGLVKLEEGGIRRVLIDP